MRIWVDADACPGPVKDLLFRAARRTQIQVTLVANQSLHVPQSDYISTLVVAHGLNVADERIVEEVQEGDLVVTADIPLADRVISKGATALDPRGELLTEQNIGSRLAARNLLDDLRGTGEVTGGPSGYGAKQKQAFANQLDRWLTSAKRRRA